MNATEDVLGWVSSVFLGLSIIPSFLYYSRIPFLYLLVCDFCLASPHLL